jgi:shikimate dehydrogenase
MVATLVYHRATLLAERARAGGHSTLDGRAMLVHQGARAFAIWTGQPAPIDVMTRALDDSLRGT